MERNKRYQEANIINHNQINIGYDNMYGGDGFQQTQGYYAQQPQGYGGFQYGNQNQQYYGHQHQYGQQIGHQQPYGQNMQYQNQNINMAPGTANHNRVKSSE